MDRKIAFMLALAMRASDLGKWGRLDQGQKRQSGRLGKMLGSRCNDLAKSKRYDLKNRLVVAAATTILSNNHCGFDCDVEECHDFSKACWVVTFHFTVGSTMRQVAFHSFDSRLGCYATRSSGPVCWLEDSSREACISLLNWLSKK